MRTLREGILHIAGAQVRVEILPDRSCEGGGCRGCGACGGHGNGRDSSFILPIVVGPGRVEGERVKVWVEAPDEALAALLLFGLPLGLLLGMGAAGNALLATAGMLGGGALGLVLGYGLVWLLRRSVLRVRVEIAENPE